MNTYIDKAIFTLLFVSFALLSVSFGFGGNERAIQKVAEFFLLDSLFSQSSLNILTGLLFLVAALLTIASMVNSKYQSTLAYWLVFLSSLPLLSLFADSRWISSLGGFPAIGSGQGVIKYFALIAIAVYFLKPKHFSEQTLQITNYVPVMLVLLWIGGMKFTELEAKGIEDLVASSPLMFWLYDLFDVQMTSNLIGVFDIIALVLLGIGLFQPKVFLAGFIMSGSVFVVTQTFLFSTPGAFSSDTVLTGTGQFLIKDLWYIANMLIILKFHQLNFKKPY